MKKKNWFRAQLFCATIAPLASVVVHTASGDKTRPLDLLEVNADGDDGPDADGFSNGDDGGDADGGRPRVYHQMRR